jgi:uncharacterized protein YecE (DUF72 family)
MGTILVGTSSWSDHREFYPPGTKPAEQLGYYAGVFPIVEVNTSYYHIPSVATVTKWAERTPEGFIFDVKPPRELTSTPDEPRGEAPEPDADLAREFADAIKPLADTGKLGALTFQFPPSYRNTEEHRDYLKLLPELFPDHPISVEFRRRDWLDDEHAGDTLELLRDARLSYTMVDEPQTGSGTVPDIYGVTNPDVAIVRFHGRNAKNWYNFSGDSSRRFDWDYTKDELSEWLPRIRRAADEAAQVHVFFNTNFEGQGPRNAELLMEQLGLLDSSSQERSSGRATMSTLPLFPEEREDGAEP